MVLTLLWLVLFASLVLGEAGVERLKTTDRQRKKGILAFGCPRACDLSLA